MSYTELYKVPEKGEIELCAEFKNAYQGAMLVWMEMRRLYLHRPPNLSGNMQSTWDLWKDKRIKLSHRIVLASTFDKVMVRSENLSRLIDAIEKYAQAFDPGHLLQQAIKLTELREDKNCYAVCWNQTSVVADAWIIYDDDNDDDSWRRFDLSKDTDYGTWFLFDELDKQDTGK